MHVAEIVFHPRNEEHSSFWMKSAIKFFIKINYKNINYNKIIINYIIYNL
jgi:hypothetical protein